MQSLQELVVDFCFPLLPRTIVETFQHADWSRAHRRGGLYGLLAEALHSLLGTNTWPFFVPVDGGWSRSGIHSLLNHYGIENWAWGRMFGELFFRVRVSKSEWAQYLLLRAGVPLKHRLLAANSANPSEAALARGAPESKRTPAPSPAPTLAQQFSALVEKIESIFDL